MEACERCKIDSKSCDNNIPCARCQRHGVGAWCVVNFSKKARDFVRAVIVNNLIRVWFLLDLDGDVALLPDCCEVMQRPPDVQTLVKDVEFNKTSGAGAPAAAAIQQVKPETDPRLTHGAGRIKALDGTDVEYVGSGGSSVVWKCVLHGKKVAVLKVTASGKKKKDRCIYYDPNNMTFLKEYLIMKRLLGLSWAPVLYRDAFIGTNAAFVQWGSGSVLASEYLSAEMYTCDRDFWELPRVQWEFVVAYISQVLTVGAEMFALGYEHRDIKPSNLVHSRFLPMHVKLCDWGGCTLRGDYKDKDGTLRYNKVWCGDHEAWVIDAVKKAAGLDHISFSQNSDVNPKTLNWYKQYVQWPLHSDDFRCVGGIGSQTYRCVGDSKRPNRMSDDSWAIGVLVVGVATGGASLKVAKLLTKQHRNDGSGFVDRKWTEFLQNKVCGDSDAKWTRWMESLWHGQRDKNEVKEFVDEEGQTILGQPKRRKVNESGGDAPRCSRKGKGFFRSEVSRHEEYVGVLNVLRKLLAQHQGCCEVLDFWKKSCSKITV